MPLITKSVGLHIQAIMEHPCSSCKISSTHRARTDIKLHFELRTLVTTSISMDLGPKAIVEHSRPLKVQPKTKSPILDLKQINIKMFKQMLTLQGDNEVLMCCDSVRIKTSLYKGHAG